jgi:phosphonate metabolism protein PhnN/1,5-bisphosphokinase (PRPP-forming)
MTHATEDHDTVSEAAYGEMAGNGDFALHWRAHGLGYGIPASVAADLAAGRCVVVNVSRAVLDEARRKFPPVTVVSVTVPPDILAERLRRRNREAADDITGRLARAAAYDVAGPDVVVLDNSGTITAAGARLAAIIADRSL